MLHVSTQDGYGTPELITPRGIARGQGDRYLLSLNRRIAEAGEPVYVRLLAEMNQANNGYSAFDRSGRLARPVATRPGAFRSAWRRSALILRGGPVAAIDAKLRRLGLPPVQGDAEDAAAAAGRAAVGAADRGLAADRRQRAARVLARAGATSTGSGTDFYSRFPNFGKLERFYDAFRGKPFVFGEWALWGTRRPGLRAALLLLDGARTGACGCTSTTRAALTNGPFRLNRYPRSRAAIRAALGNRRYLQRPVS